MEQEVDKESGNPSPETDPDSENTKQGGDTLQPEVPLIGEEDYLRDDAFQSLSQRIDGLTALAEQLSARVNSMSDMSAAVNTVLDVVANTEAKCDSLLSALLEIRNNYNSTERKLDEVGSEVLLLKTAIHEMEELVVQQQQETSTSTGQLQQTVGNVSTTVEKALQGFNTTLDEQVASLQSLTETYTACAELISKLDSRIVNGVNEWLAVSTTAVSDTFLLSGLISDIGPVLNDLRSLKAVVDTLVLSSLNIEKVFKEWNVYGSSVSAMLNTISTDIHDMKDTKLLLEKISTVTGLIESLSNTVVNAVSIKKKIVV